MTEELKIAIDELYDKFSHYRLRPIMDGCPCCVSNADKQKLHTKSLKHLDRDDLDNYAFKAMTTWGDADDFKHFLPRIFELLASNQIYTDTFVILGKLNLANWKEWKDEEIESVKQFLLAWWTDLTKNKVDFDSEAFMEISKQIGDVQPLLDRWKISFDDSSFRNLIDFIYSEVQLLDREKRIFTYKNIHADTIEKIKSWLIKQTKKFEQGFFKFEKTEPEFAERVSICYDILKGLKIVTA